MTRVRPLAHLRAILAGAAVVLLTFSAAGAIVLVTAQSAHAAAVVITGPSASAGITQNPTVFTGTGTPGDTVTLSGSLLTASPCASGVTVDVSGNWSCDANFSAPGGATTILATQTGDGSTANGSYDVAFPPTEQLTPTSPGRYATNNNSPVIPGTDAISGGTVQGTLSDGTNTYSCSYNVVSGPSFSCAGFAPVPDGDYTLQLTQSYGTATSAPGAPITVRIDTLGPSAAPQFVSPYDSTGPNANVHTTNASMPVSGTYSSAGVPEAYATVHVEADVESGPVSNNNGGTPSYCDAITDASGNWSCTPPTPMIYGDYYGFTVWGADEAGNTGISPDPEFGVYVDVPAPVPDTTTVIVNQPIVELTGTGATGGTVHGAFSNGQSCDAVVNSGFYECDVTLAPATDGTYTVVLSQTVGTTASLTNASVTVVLDQTPPTTSPTFSAPWATGSSPARAVATSPPVFSGTAEPNAEVSVLVAEDPDGYPADVPPSQPVCSAAADAAGNWSCDSTLEGMSMGLSYSVGAQQWDAAFNAGPAAVATFELYLDNPPAAPTITTPAAGSASLRPGDTVTFSGTTQPDTTVKVYQGSTVLCQASSSSGSWSCSVPSLAAGSHTVAAIAVDGLGVSSPAVTRTFAVVAPVVAPTALVFSIGVTDADGNPLDGTELTPGQTIILWSSGLPADSTVSAELHSTPYPLGSATVGSDGTFKLKTRVPLDIEPGDHEFSVTVTPAGVDPTTVTTPTSVAPAPVEPPADTPPKQTTDTGIHRPAQPADGFDSPSTFASTLPVFGSFVITPTSVAVTGGIALAFLLLVAFPSELLEDTIRENYDRVFGWMAPLRRRIGHLRGRGARMLRSPWAGIALSVVATSIILGFSDPAFGFNGASVRLLLGMLISVLVINIGINLLVLKVAKRKYDDAGFIRPMPAALIIVALSVLVSRLADISPGFLFGLVMGVAYARELKAVQEAKLALLGAALTISAGILAWLGFSALRAAGGSGFWYELSLESLVAITLEAVGTMIIAMLPLTFLDGKTIFRWNKWAWAGIYLVTVLVFVVIVLPISDNWGTMSAPIFGWATLFVVFAVVALGTWAVFRFVPRRVRADETESDAQGELVEAVPRD
jgi:hypothetical protein